jgi:hypothetical protein
MLDARERSSSSSSAPTALDDAVVVAASRAKIDAVPRAVDARARARDGRGAHRALRRARRVNPRESAASACGVAIWLYLLSGRRDRDATGRALSIATIMAKAIALIEP